MWALIFRRVRLLLVAAVLLPVVSSIARRLAERVERQQDGPTRGSRGLRAIETGAIRARSLVR